MRYVFGIWTALVALTVSVVAAYYSIIGLTAIFAAAVVPIIIMGAALEIAKITTAVWLHSFWHEAPRLMRYYLTIATIVLMLITSMGIFGFLSKAHIEQNAGGLDLSARIERFDNDIARQEQIIKRAENKIIDLDRRTDTTDAGIQDKIQDQQNIITQIEERLARDIATQNSIIDQELSVLQPLKDELTRIDQRRERLRAAIASNDVRALQTLIGVSVDGVYGSQTAAKVNEYRNDLETQRNNILSQIETNQSTDNEIVKQARAEIQQLQNAANIEIQRANDAINQFRNQLIDTTAIDNSGLITEQETIIDSAGDEIDTILSNKFKLETELRQLEVEVGPVKYIAELVYGETSQEILEKSVRWVIMTLVFVFDPLAVVLILAGISLLRKEPIDNSVNISNNEELPEDDNVVIEDTTTINEAEVTPTESIVEVSEATPPVATPNPPSTGTANTGYTGNDVNSDVVTVAGRRVPVRKN